MQENDLFAECPPDDEQWFHQDRQVGYCLDKLQDAGLEPHRSDHAHLEAEVRLHSRKGGVCCDGNEAMHLSEVDWDVKDGHYRARVPTTSGGFERAMAGAINVETEWVYVPDAAVVDEPNRANVTLVWPLYGPMGVSVRCFMPGTMT